MGFVFHVVVFIPNWCTYIYTITNIKILYVHLKYVLKDLYVMERYFEKYIPYWYH
jgi:hypothetical protein